MHFKSIHIWTVLDVHNMYHIPLIKVTNIQSPKPLIIKVSTKSKHIVNSFALFPMVSPVDRFGCCITIFVHFVMVLMHFKLFPHSFTFPFKEVFFCKQPESIYFEVLISKRQVVRIGVQVCAVSFGWNILIVRSYFDFNLFHFSCSTLESTWSSSF